MVLPGNRVLLGGTAKQKGKTQEGWGGVTFAKHVMCVSLAHPHDR